LSRFCFHRASSITELGYETGKGEEGREGRNGWLTFSWAKRRVPDFDIMLRRCDGRLNDKRNVWME
jgi:hypothetical protein